MIDKQAHTQKDKWIDKDKQSDSQTDRQKERKTNRYVDKYIYRQTGRQISRQREKQRCLSFCRYADREDRQNDTNRVKGIFINDKTSRTKLYSYIRRVKMYASSPNYQSSV